MDTTTDTTRPTTTRAGLFPFLGGLLRPRGPAPRRPSAALRAVGGIAAACALLGGAHGAHAAGNIYLTGHDTLLHGGQFGYDNVILDYLRCAGEPAEIPRAAYRIAVIGSSSTGGHPFTWRWSTPGTGINNALFATPVTFIDAETIGSPAAWGPALMDSSGNALYDVIVVLSHTSCGGCSMTDLGSANLNLAKPLITSLFNGQGMDIWANAGAALPTYYDFLPVGFVTTAPPIFGSTFCATTDGAAIGITPPMTTCCQTHNKFVAFSPVLTVMETDCPAPGDDVISVGAKGVLLGDCAMVADVNILCEVGEGGLTGDFLYTFTFTNNTSPPLPIQFLFTPSASGVLFQQASGPPQHSLALTTPVAPGATSGPITVIISGPSPGERFCFDVTFGDPDIEICCETEVCVDLPECDCVQFPECSVACVPGFPNEYVMTFTAQNLSLEGAINELHIFPLPLNSGVTVDPADFFFASTPMFGTAGSFNTFITGASPGRLCFQVSVHLDGVLCCSDIKCVTLPFCPNPWMGCAGDVNGDGIVNIQDFLAFLSAYAAGGAPGDFNHDGVVDVQDFLEFLSAYAVGCP